MVNAADELGLPLSPPYLLANKSDIWLTGYNYASAASGILPESGSILGKLFNMDTQIDFFNETIELVLKKRFKNPVHLSKQLAKSIFLFVTGSNDYLNNYFIIGYPHINMFPGPFADLILEVLSMQMKRLYSLGTRKVMFAEIPPVGCMPFVSASYFDLGLICNGMNNAAVTFFNQRLGNFFDDLRSTLPGFEVTLVKSYDISYDIFQHPSKYGLANSKDACCQTILSLLTCQERGSTCRNHSDHCFWDSFHPTEAFNSVIVSKCKTDKSVCTPMNIEQLANA